MLRIGIRREDKNLFERRVPLTPRGVSSLITDHDVPFTVQPAPRRIFADEEYRSVGATLAEDLDDCPVVLGVKEIPAGWLQPGRVYVYFSHTIKGQPANMPMLRRLMELGCTLLDYELIVDEQGQRQVFFGRHAGLAGMIDTLWALGQRLAQGEGIETPLAGLRQAFGYDSLDQAEQAIRSAGARLREEGIPEPLAPLVVGFAGYGNVSIGAQQIYDLLDPVELAPEDLAAIDPGDRSRCYKVVFREEHLVERLRGTFELQHYYDHPEEHRPVFAERHLPWLTVLVNCIYWSPRFPRLVTLNDLEDLYGAAPRLRVIGDISCDLDGAIEATVKATEPDRPVFVYDLDRREALDGVAGRGPVILAVDNLPAELPRDASEWFSRSLAPLVPALAAARFDAASLDETGLPDALRRAVIVYRGALTPELRRLEEPLARHG